MASVLLAALHGSGAATNLEPLVLALKARGHEVVLLSDPAARSMAEASGARFVPLSDPVLHSVGQRPAGRLQRIRRLRPNMRAAFLDPIPRQWEAVQRVLAQTPVDVVLTDLMVFGAAMLAVLPRAERPAVGVLGLVPPPAPDPDIAPYGTGIAPLPGTAGRVRNAVLRRAVAEPMLGGLEREFREIVQRTTGYRFDGSLWDLATRAEVWAQAGVPRFAYPRANPPANLRWIGPLAARESPGLPDWWDPRSEPPTVVVHTDGRVPLAQVVLPVVEAMQHDDSVTIVSGATREDTARSYGRPLPANVHFEAVVPWSRLLPGRTVFVSTGDYVQVLHALRRGVPVVVTGASEPQIETKARIEWTGVGVDVPAAEPTPEMLRAAIQRVRSDPEIHSAAARVAAQIAGTNAEKAICDMVEDLAQQERRAEGLTSTRDGAAPRA